MADWPSLTRNPGQTHLARGRAAREANAAGAVVDPGGDAHPFLLDGAAPAGAVVGVAPSSPPRLRPRRQRWPAGRGSGPGQAGRATPAANRSCRPHRRRHEDALRGRLQPSGSPPLGRRRAEAARGLARRRRRLTPQRLGEPRRRDWIGDPAGHLAHRERPALRRARAQPRRLAQARAPGQRPHRVRRRGAIRPTATSRPSTGATAARPRRRCRTRTRPAT